MKRLFFPVLMFFFLFLEACSLDEGFMTSDSENVSIVSWNVQTFFNAESDGTEYSNFCDKTKWNREKYLARLERLCNALVELDADIYVLEEIENESVIYDISNQLSGKSWDSGKKWAYSCFAKDVNSAIGCAVLSRYELTGMNCHCIDVRTTDEKQPVLRYLIEVEVKVKDRLLTVLANHWKSKLNDAEGTEVWRQFQESLLVLRLLELKDASVVICGDFNKDIGEFCIERYSDEAKVLLKGDSLKCEDSFSVSAGWLLDEQVSEGESGSYYYKDSWERIDSIFIFGNCSFLKFEPCVNDLWCDEDGHPDGYKIYSGEGVSDHLPVKAYLRF